MAKQSIAPDPTKEILPENHVASIYEQSSKERDTAKRNFNRYFYVRGRGHLEYIKEANEFDKFYRGEQWTDEDKQTLEAAGRPAMTINMILTAVNSVKGEYSNKRADFRLKPKRDGATVDQAGILNKVIMHECDDTDYDDKEAEMFSDGLITDRGYLDIRIDTQENEAGEIEISLRDPRSVIPDPDAHDYDPKTWGDVITTEFVSLEELAMRYGDEKARLVRMNIDSLGTFATDSVEFYEGTNFGDDMGMDYGVADGAFYSNGDGNEKNVLKSVRIIDRQYWQVGNFKHFLNPVIGDTTPVPLNWAPERVAQHADQYGLEIIEKRQKRVRWTVSADKTLLHDEWSPYASFTIIPFFPYFRRGHPVGLVRNLTSSQEILNKSTSQMLHVVNTTANSGWIYRSGSLMNMTADDLAETGSQTGIVLEVAPGAEAPEKIQPNQVPSGLDNVGGRAMESIFEISGVNRAMQGTEKAHVSGIALENRQARGLLQLQPVFDNLARSRRFVGRKFIELIQKFYTDERVFMISDYTAPYAQPQEMGVNQMVPDQAALEEMQAQLEQMPPEQQQQAVAQLEQQFAQQGPPMTIVNDLSVGKYGVVIGSMPAKDVYSEVQFTEALTLREAGVQIPDYRILGYSNLDDKEEMVEESKQMQGLAPPTEEELKMQQFQQDVQMQMIQLQLESTTAEIELKQAQAALAEAKALEASDTPALEREKLELEATITAIEQATRERVSNMKELSSQMSAMNNNKAKLQIEQQKIMGSIATAKLSQKAESKSTEKAK